MPQEPLEFGCVCFAFVFVFILHFYTFIQVSHGARTPVHTLPLKEGEREGEAAPGKGPDGPLTSGFGVLGVPRG